MRTRPSALRVQAEALRLNRRGQPFVSSALMDPMTEGLRGVDPSPVRDQGVDLVHFRKDQNKDDVAKAYLSDHDRSEGVRFVGMAQEKTAGAPHPEAPQPPHRQDRGRLGRHLVP